MISFIALLRKELWEHTALWRAPAGLLLLVLLANLAAIFWGKDLGIQAMVEEVRLQGEVDQQLGLGMARGLGEALHGILSTISLVINAVLQILIVIYLLDSLFRERRDRSILFWKSLPVGDSAVVLSKLVTASLVVPLIGCLTTAAGQLLTLAMQGLSFFDLPGFWPALWRSVRLPDLWSSCLLLRIEQMLWAFPLLGWMLFCSAWARKSPFTIAILLPLLLAFIDSAFRLHTGFSGLLLERVGVWWSASGSVMVDGMGMDSAFRLAEGDLAAGVAGIWNFLGNAKVFYGLLVGLLFVLAAIQVRRHQGDGPN